LGRWDEPRACWPLNAYGTFAITIDTAPVPRLTLNLYVSIFLHCSSRSPEHVPEYVVGIILITALTGPEVTHICHPHCFAQLISPHLCFCFVLEGLEGIVSKSASEQAKNEVVTGGVTSSFMPNFYTQGPRPVMSYRQIPGKLRVWTISSWALNRRECIWERGHAVRHACLHIVPGFGPGYFLPGQHRGRRERHGESLHCPVMGGGLDAKCNRR
jgi:hypothetical protein